MKKLMTVLLGILLVASVSNAADGDIYVTIAPTTALTVTSYPISTIGTAVTVLAGGTVSTNAATGVNVVDNTVKGWTLSIASANNGTLNNAIAGGGTMAYTLTTINEIGSYGGLTLAPAFGTTFTPTSIVTPMMVAGTGPATAATNYTFDLQIDVAGDAAGTLGKLAGDYHDTITLTLAANP